MQRPKVVPELVSENSCSAIDRIIVVKKATRSDPPTLRSLPDAVMPDGDGAPSEISDGEMAAMIAEYETWTSTIRERERLHGSCYFVPRTSAHVGLYNQGATCYLNSLLQTLYYTAEFRKAF